MKVGVDTFTLYPLNLDPFEQLDFIKAAGLDGAQFGGLRSLSKNLELSELKAVRERADSLGLYSHVSLSVACNPHLVAGSADEHRQAACQEIELAAQCGWHELHSTLGGGDERYLHAVPWPQQLADSALFIRSLAPVLRQHGSRIDLETHGDSTTFELVRLIEDVGPDCVGICLDTANVMCHCEEPVAAVRRAAPYTHLTHTKDAVVFFSERGYVRQTVPPGRGAIEWEKVLPVLAAHSPNLPMSIEDHKWLFYFHGFDPAWLALHPDLTLEEYASFMQLIWKCQQRLAAGEFMDPLEYDKIPYASEVNERLQSGRDYLKSMIARLGLGDCPHDDTPRSLSMMRP
ncbi:MAG: sugar phosphate isomerase/epimerase [bacterium]